MRTVALKSRVSTRLSLTEWMERRRHIIVEIIIALVAVAVGLAAGYWIRKSLAEAKIASAEEAARKILDDAQHQADARKKELLIEAKEEIHRFRIETERELKERRSEVQRMERRLQQISESAKQRSSIGKIKSISYMTNNWPNWNDWRG